MDSLLALTSSSSLSITSQDKSFQATYYRSDALVIEATLSGEDQDAATLNLDGLYRGLSKTAREILDKLNQLLKSDLPNGIESLKPEDVTPEATSDRIVKSVTAYFDLYRKQHSELSDDEALDNFMEAVHSGVTKGYDDAFNTLEGLGAFEFDGVKEGVEQTKLLIESKLDAFYQSKRKELGIEPLDAEKDVATITSNNLLAQVGGSLSVVA